MRCPRCGKSAAHGPAVRWKGKAGRFCCPGCAIEFLRGSRDPEVIQSTAVRRYEKAHGCRLLLLLHRDVEEEGQDTFISVLNSEEILSGIRRIPPDEPLHIVLHTPGGLVLAAEQIALAVRRHRGPTQVLVPHYAMSGGTLIALAANEILMDPYSVLGPLDPQIDGVPSPALVRLLKRKRAELLSDETLVAIDTAEHALVQMRDFIRWLLRGRLSPRKLERVVRVLTSGELNHDSPITPGDAAALGLPIRAELPPEAYEILAAFRLGRGRPPSLLAVPCGCLPRTAGAAAREGGGR